MKNQEIIQLFKGIKNDSDYDFFVNYLKKAMGVKSKLKNLYIVDDKRIVGVKKQINSYKLEIVKVNKTNKKEKVLVCKIKRQ